MKKHVILIYTFILFVFSVQAQAKLDSLEYVNKIDSLKKILGTVINKKEQLEPLKKLVKLTNSKDKQLMFTYLQKLIAIAEKENAYLFLAFGKEYLGSYHYTQNDIDASIAGFSEAVQAYKEAGQINKSLLMQSKVGGIHCIQGNYKISENILREVISSCDQDSLNSVLAFSYNQMGTLYHYQMVTDSASIYYTKSEKIYRQIKDTIQMLRPMHNHAILMNSQDKTFEAIEIQLKIKELREQSVDRAGLMVSLNTLAGLYDYEGQYLKAADYALEAYAIAEEIDDKSIQADILKSLAKIYFNNKDHENSLKYINKSAKIAKETKNMDQLLFVTENQSEILTSIGKFEEAKSVAQAGIDIVSQNKLREEKAVFFYLILAKIFLKENNIIQSKIYLNLSKPFISDKSPINKNNYYFIAAKISSKEKNHTGTIKNGEIIIDNLIKSKEGKNSYLIANLLSEAYEQKGNFEKALYYSKMHLSLIDSLNSSDNIREITKKTKDFEFEQEKKLLALQKEKDEAVLKAQTRQSRIIAIGIGALALLGFGFFWNARRQNKIIATQNKTLEGLNTTKDRIFAIIGHDLRKPALAFRGITEKVNYLLKNQDFERLNKLGITIEREALSLNKLTDNLLNWALMQRDVLPHNPTNINIKEIIDEVIDLFTTTAVNKNISIQSNIDSNLQVLADPDALRIIIRNLIDNAIKYTPHGGTVEIEADVRNNQVQINIIDDGIGMERHKLQSIFLLQKDKSKRGTAGEKGTGLGLHLVEELIKINKGSIKAMSQLGQGTSFNIALPIAK